MLDVTLEAGNCEAVGDGAGKPKGHDGMVLPVRDPVDVLREAFAERAKWGTLFREAGLSSQEREDLIHTIEEARGGQDHPIGRRQRAIEQLMAGRGDWFESLIREPSKLAPHVRAALAGAAARFGQLARSRR